MTQFSKKVLRLAVTVPLMLLVVAIVPVSNLITDDPCRPDEEY